MVLFFFKQKTAYEMRISDWSSDVCSSDLFARLHWRAVRHDNRQLLPRAAETARFARQARDGAVARTAVRVDEQEFRKRDGVFQAPNKPRGRAGQPDADIAAALIPLFRIYGPGILSQKSEKRTRGEKR